MSLREKLGKQMLFFDGAMGTQLQARGLQGGELPELWNITHPTEMQSVHEAYLRAGCRLMKTNTFGAFGPKLAAAGTTVQAVVTAAMQNARAAIEAVGVTDAYVGLDIGPCGRLLQPFGDLPFEEAVGMFSEIVEVGKAAADYILIETMSDIYETKAAVLAAKEHSDLPIIVTLTFDQKGKLLTGADVRTAVLALQDLGIDAIGFNCGLGPQQMLEMLPALREVCALPIAVSPNAGLPQMVDGNTVFNVGPAEFAADAVKLAEGGAAILGGCCGTTPEHLAAVIAACAGKQPKPISQNIPTAVTSYNRAAVFGGRPLLVGERLNPTGKARLKQALREENMPYILEMGVEQDECGADILDVNVGLPELDEPAVMTKVVTALQAVTGCPLQIDTTDPVAMERALRLYNGKPILNSVNGKQEILDTVLPLVKKYGAVVVGLTLDETGIPDTAAGRVAIAERIAAACDRYGIPRRNLVIDALCMTVSTGTENANITLETVAAVRKMGLHTILGVSNVSFGLPLREELNASFFTQALRMGLSSGIVNPLSNKLMDAYASYCALAGLDDNCTAYIGRMADRDAAEKAARAAAPTTTAQPTATVDKSPLHVAIVKGFAEEAYTRAKAMLTETAPLTLINSVLIPALDEVGKGFESGRLFLPQLLTSAQAAQSAFAAVREHLQASGNKQQTKAKLVIATVKGDIHDIGKNIVKVLLENYGYEVIDLGKDVPPETVVEAVVRENISLVLLSALMTTTVPSMEETIRQLRAAVPACRVAVGGAVLTQEYADRIGADFYGADALAAVRYADSLFA